MIKATTFRIAARALRRNTLRTMLTMLGIIIGVSAVIAMVSIGQGARAQVEAQIASLGQNVILVMSGNVTRGGFRMGFGSAGSLTLEDYEAIRRELFGVNRASPEVRAFAQVAAGNQNLNTSVMGVSSDYLDLRSWALRSGENFTEQDVRNANKVALIGNTTAEALFGDGDPVGQIIRVKSAPFTIVGSLAPKGMSMTGSDQDDTLLVPYTSAMKRLTGGSYLRSLTIQAPTTDLLDELKEQVTALLRQRHRIGPDRDDDFIVRTQQEITDMATSTSKIMTVLLGSIAGVSLLVGGIGIMNIMLVSVTERTREVGTRLAIGALASEVLLQFLVEAVVLALLGGILGILFGLSLSYMATQSLSLPFVFSPGTVAGAFAFSAAVGVIFGYLPARKAARLNPIEALRHE
jgi:putative ABC transport system permease protein